MSTEQNIANYRRFIEEAWNEGKLEVIQEIASPDVVLHSPPGTPPGPEGVKQVVAAFRAAFPDVCITVEDQLAEGDRIVARWTITGTHRGPFRNYPPTGKRISAEGMEIFRYDADGKWAECWSKFPLLELLQQIGAVPAAGPSVSQATASTLTSAH